MKSFSSLVSLLVVPTKIKQRGGNVEAQSNLATAAPLPLPYTHFRSTCYCEESKYYKEVK